MKTENRSIFYKLVFILLIVLILIIVPMLVNPLWIAVIIDLVILNGCLFLFLAIKNAKQYPDDYNENLNNK